MRDYYDLRADEYDATSWGAFAGSDAEPARELAEAVAALPQLRTLDVGCGTGFLTRYLRGRPVALDQSARRLGHARARGLDRVVRADALALPFRDRAFQRVFSSFLYCHLVPADASRFVAETARVAAEVIVVTERRRAGSPPDGLEARPLGDGSSHQVYKRYFTPEALARELGGGSTIFVNELFVMHRAPA